MICGVRIIAYPLVTGIMIDTNNQNNKPNNGHAFAHGTSGIGTSHVWKDKSDANTPPNFQLGWGFLCGFSGSADIWIDSLRFNFLRGVENGALQDVKWTTQYSTIPDGSSTLGYKSTDINICQKASDAGIKQTIKYSQSYSVSTTTKYSNTFGMKLSNKISMTAKQGLKVGEASSELTQSVELSTDFSSSTTNENQEVKSETQTTDSTLELPLPCPTDDYAKKSQLSFPMYCQWSFGYDLAFTWNNDAWVGSMVYTLEGGGKITFPAKGSTSGKYYTANFGMRNFNCSNHDEPTTNRAGIKQQMDMPPSPLSKYPVTAAASLAGSSAVPPVNSKATGYVSITIVNASYASGLFYATNVKQMTMAHLHNGAVGNNGPPIAWAFNATYGPLSGSLKAFFRFDPSLSNFSALLAAGQVYFNIHTVAYPAGELRGQL